ncbi:MAG: hypothetical protein AAFV95_23680 [Bacteroidota bacterium]
MRNTRLAYLLFSLKPKERQLFGQLLSIGYFKATDLGTGLFDYLQARKFKPLEGDKKTILLDFFGEDSEAADKQLRHQMSLLSKLVQDFIALQTVRKTPSLLLHFAALGLAARGVFKEFLRISQKLIKKLEEKLLPHGYDHWMLMRLNRQLFFHPDVEKIKMGQPYIEAAMQHLDMAYLLSKLRLSCELTNREITLSEKYHIPLLKECMELGQQWVDRNTLINVYMGIIQLQTRGFSAELFTHVKSVYFQHLEQLEEEEQRLVLMYLINIVAKEITKGRNQHLKECLELYKYALSTGALLKHQRMTYPTYTNIAAIGSLIDPDWTRDFIEEYIQHLEKDHQQDAYSIARAFWHFNQQQFYECFQALEQLTYLHIPYNFRIRSLLIRTFYELSYTNGKMEDSLANELENLYRFISKYRQSYPLKGNAYMNFYGFTRTLIGHRWTTISANRKKELTERLRNMDVCNRAWLEEKLMAIGLKR